MSQENLLEKLSKVKTEETSTGIIGSENLSDKLPIGENLTVSEPAPAAKVEDSKTVKNPEEWSKDSALKEVVKLREENKAYRTKFQEQLDKLAKEKEEAIAKVREEAQTALEAKKKLEAIEADQADKKRSIEEKLANREARLVEVENVYKRELEEKEKLLASYKSKATQYEAEQEARQQVYRDKIKEELGKIPEEFRSFADKMVKGYEDPHEAWLSLSEAQRMGMFGEKKIVVNHSVPGANDGARLSKDKIEEQERAERAKLPSMSLIRMGLQKAVKEKNPIFKK
jgi:chromosome segregation ATPase